MTKRFLILLLVLISLLVLATPVFALTYDKVIVSAGKYVSDPASGFYGFTLYYDEDTPITIQWLLDHPDKWIDVKTHDLSMFNIVSYPRAMGPYVDTTYRAVRIDAALFQDVVDYPENYPNVDITKGLYLKFYESTERDDYFTITSNIVIDSEPTEPEPTEPDPTESEPTEPGPTIVPPTEDEVDDPGWLDGLIDGFVNGVKNILQTIFGSVIDFFDRIKTAFDDALKLTDRFADLKEVWDDFSSFTLDPITDFFNSISAGSISVIMQIWNFPIIDSFALGKVALLVISGILILMITF